MASQKVMQANGTILVSRFVKIDTTDNNALLQCGAGEAAFGIAQTGGRTAPIPSVTADPVQAAIAGENIGIHTDGDFALLAIGTGGCTAGAYLKSDSTGRGVALSATAGTRENYGAIALETAAVGELAKVQVKVGTITHPA